MARSSSQKLKPLYIMTYLLRESDQEHPLTIRQIVDHLAGLGIRAERKSVYDDIEALRTFGLDIVLTGEGSRQGYFVAQRTFQLPELKLLVDSVQSSRSITTRKTDSLIRKIETLASVHEAQLLQRQVYVKDRVKSMNESVLYNVDEIHSGICRDRKIRFHYFEYTTAKERRLRRGGDFYVVSPYAMTYDSENYYLIAYDAPSGILKHYRVDKMVDISTLEEPRDQREAYASLDVAAYARKLFGMFSGEEVTVRLRFEDRLIGAVLDRLGHDVMVLPQGDGHFTVTAGVVVSPQFFAWITGFGAGAQILGPEAVVDQMRSHIRSVAALYP